MPIDYRKYHPEWRRKIRPDILARANNRCEACMVKNYQWILRGVYKNRPAYQDENGSIFCANTGVRLGDDYVGEICTSEKTRFIKIVLTIAHLDHNIENNKYENLRALCQRCHLHHDKEHHRINRKKTHIRKKKQGIIDFE